jgi:hypothetical protein
MKPCRIITQQALDANEVLGALQVTFNTLFVGTPIEIMSMGVVLTITRTGGFIYIGYATLVAPKDEDFKEFEKLLKGTKPEPPGNILTLK